MSKSLIRFGIVLAALALAVPSWAQDEDPADGDPTADEPIADEPTADEPSAPGDDASTEQTPPRREVGQDGGGVTESAEINYDLRLRELEDRVNDLKEEIFRSKSRLFLLRQQILQDNIGGSRALVTHNNLMSSRYRLVEALYSLDGNQIFFATEDDAEIDDHVEIYNSTVIPGPHNLAVRLVLEGNGYGIFSYMSGYRFTITSSHAFQVEEGQTVMIDVVAYERGGVNEAIEDRPDIRYEEDRSDTTAEMSEGDEGS